MPYQRSTIAVVIIVLLIVSGCSVPREREPEEAGVQATPTSSVVSAPLTPLRIVTPTPVDPRQIPATSTGTPGEFVVPEVYVVQEGDSLYSIAVRFRLELAEIVALNGLSDPNDISVGQELRLPVP